LLLRDDNFTSTDITLAFVGSVILSEKSIAKPRRQQQ